MKNKRNEWYPLAGNFLMMGYTLIKAEFSLISSEEGGRKKPVKSGYSPNHQFDDESYCIGVIEFADDDWHFPGETNEVFVKMLDSPRCQERLVPGFSWRVTEGTHVIGTLTMTSFIEHKSFEDQ